MKQVSRTLLSLMIVGASSVALADTSSAPGPSQGQVAAVGGGALPATTQAKAAVKNNLTTTVAQKAVKATAIDNATLSYFDSQTITGKNGGTLTVSKSIEKDENGISVSKTVTLDTDKVDATKSGYYSRSGRDSTYVDKSATVDAGAIEATKGGTYEKTSSGTSFVGHVTVKNTNTGEVIVDKSVNIPSDEITAASATTTNATSK